MPIGQGDYIPGEEKNAEADGVGVLSFEEVMLARVKRDYELARRFREVRRRTRPMGVFSDRTSIERILFAVFSDENRKQGAATPFLLTQNT